MDSSPASDVGHRSDQITSSTLRKKAPPPPPPKKSLFLSQPNGPAKDSEVVDFAQQGSLNGQPEPMKQSVASDPLPSEAASVPSPCAVAGDPITVPAAAATLQSESQTNANQNTESQEADDANNSTSAADLTPNEQPVQQEAQQLIATRIGRPITENGKRLIIDEAEWEPLVPQTTLDAQFAILIQRDGEKDRLTLLSPYLQKVFRAVVRYFPEVIIDNKTISFAEPYAPLYFYMEEMYQYVQDDKDPSAEPEDLNVLLYFYNKWVAPLHARVRDTLTQGSAIFEHLWALYKPGECLYQLDEFEQPRLYVTAATIFRTGFKAGGNDLGNIFPLLPNMNAVAGRFAVDAWCTEWDTATQAFTRKLTTMVIQSFSGTRSITSLDFYPLKHYKNGDRGEIDNLLSTLEDRGYTWKGLVSEPSSCLYHDGPARELRAGLFRTMMKDKINVSANPSAGSCISSFQIH